MDRETKINKIQQKSIKESDKSRTQLYKETKGTELGIRKQDFLKYTKKARKQGKPTIKPKKKKKEPKKKEKKKKKPLSEAQKKGLAKGQIKNKLNNTDMTQEEIINSLQGSDLDTGSGFLDYLKNQINELTGEKPSPVKEGYDLWRYEDQHGNEYFIKENKEDPFTLNRLQQLERLKENDSIAKINLDNLTYLNSYEYKGLNVGDLT